MLQKIKYAYLGLFFFLFAGVINTSYAKTDINKLMESAVGVWLFDEGKGQIAKDLSKEGNDGELVKNPKWVKGKFGQALEFDGKASCVKTGEKLLDNLKEFTIILWVNTGEITADRVGLIGQNDAAEFGFINPASVNLWSPASEFTHEWNHGHPSNDWHHIAAVAGSKKITIYIDGEAKDGGGAGPHGTSTFGVNIGGCGIWDGGGNWFTGAMDEVAIFHSALKEEDIMAIMNDGFGNLLAVAAKGKLPVYWADIKENR